MGRDKEIKTENIKDQYAQKVMTRLNTEILPLWSEYFRTPIENIDKELRKLPYPCKISPYYAKYFEYIIDEDEIMPFPKAFVLCQFFWSSNSIYSFRISREEMDLFEKCFFDILPLRVEEKINEILSDIAKEPVMIHLCPKDHEIDPKVSLMMLHDFDKFMKGTKDVWI